jgi:hypothetical protein
MSYLIGFAIGAVIASCVFLFIPAFSAYCDEIEKFRKEEYDEYRKENGYSKFAIPKFETRRDCENNKNHINSENVHVIHSGCLINTLCDRHSQSNDGENGVNDNGCRYCKNTLMKDGKSFKISIEEIKN